MEFSDKYNYDESIISSEFDEETQRGMLETYGADYEQVVAINEKTPQRVWSVIDGDDNRLHVIAGIALCTHIVYHIITTEEWQSKDESYPLV